MSEVPQSIIDKIKKLLNLADQSKNDSQAEAENAARKAQDLMLEYNLDIQKIHGSSKDNPIKKHHVDPEALLVKNEGPWLKSLFYGIAKNNFCKAWTLANGHNGMTIIGELQNIELTLYMVDQLIPRIRNLAKEAWRDYEGHEKRNTFTRGFLMGCTRGIIDKLSQNLETQSENNQNVKGLILAKGYQLEKYMQENNINLVARGGKGLSGKSGYTLGQEAGSNMQVYKGVGKSSNSQNYLN